MIGYQLQKEFDEIFSHLDTIHQCERQTDRQRDGQTGAS